MSAPTPLRWGVLSTANIALKKVVPAMQASEHAVIAAIASRDLDRAEGAARELGIARAYGSYDDLLADPDIDAIYNPLPNHLHVPWSIRALEAGKHVLVEKPVALSSAEGETLLAAARAHPHLTVAEAFMYRHHPQWQLAKRIVDEGGVGRLRVVQTHFSYHNTDPHNVRNHADKGGGGLMDIGCYAINVARLLYGSEPLRVFGTLERDPGFGTDRVASAILEFEGGTSTFTCATQLAPYQRVNAIGDDGRVEIEIPFNAPPDRPCRVFHQRGDTTEEHELPVADQYTLQADAFARAVHAAGAPATTIEDALANMRVLEAILASDREGCWIRP